MKNYKREFMGELLGTFILVLFGCGTVANSILFDSYQGIVQIALMWGIGVSLAIYITRHLSCAHLNPAVTIAMAANGRMNIRKVPAYLAAQFSGAFLAGIVLYGLFAANISEYESINGIVRGTPESMAVAKMFGEYYQSAGGSAAVSMPIAMAAEGLGTFLLVLMIFGMTEGCNLGKPDNNLAPLFIGLSVSSSTCLVGPLTQAGLNPARDVGPRLAAWIFGWGSAAFPDSTGGFFFVYMLAPVIGALLAGTLFTGVLQNLMQQQKEECCTGRAKPDREACGCGDRSSCNENN
ncbi:MIP/aquaporin family protein [Anaerobium acetethylicum]|uniref:Glycerol uptake facilitator protein n=1 Tax=Anaerobium acetethylicum TaxID=1619234 RepID=A0A1D3TVE9_9FIRM|nr:MIP/aquaporin family protein [Anaerobium acetethylicum]SCP98123.1 glycerol uptake facilitator protein [Anaerobium acetethylicum]